VEKLKEVYAGSIFIQEYWDLADAAMKKSKKKDPVSVFSLFA